MKIHLEQLKCFKSKGDFDLHIMEGFLPIQWAVFWFLVSIPVIIYGIRQIRKIIEKRPESKPLLAVSGAFMFVLSSLKLPSITGTSSHATGNGLSAILFGPAVTAVLASIVLVFQALLLAHGGLTTLGANIFSMGIVGPFAAWLVYRMWKKTGLALSYGVFLAAFAGDLLTYVTTAGQIALAFPVPTIQSAFFKYMAIFAYTQLPLAVAEGFITVIIIDYIVKLRPDILQKMDIIKAVPQKGGK